ncbi:DUF4350 domain-containing protein [Pseudokineococcus sp. 1T1Z-3]|uniref:DUF4350 domain-containing protein n=1 Tax=Pseudokineococcus sp. 1T1Z-3 TaxID=3132745 RepID=UPI0030AC9B5D
MSPVAAPAQQDGGATVDDRLASSGAADRPGDAAGPGDRARRRRRRLLVAALALLVLAALVVGSLGRTADDLDPASATPGGSRALAQVLGDRGVEVVRTTSTQETVDAVAAAGPGGAAVLVVPTSPLATSQLDDLAASGADLLLVAPQEDVLAALAPSLVAADVIEAAEGVPPQCEQPDAVAAGTTTGGGVLVEPADDEDPAVTSCYGLPFGGAPYVVVEPAGAAAGERATAGPGRVVVLGQPEVLTNERVSADGNAALALRTLGARDTLVWYLPDPLDPALAGDDATPLAALVPPGLVRSVYVLGAAVLVLLLWRGRRLGRLVPERLPVLVRAAETVEGRARLYRASGAREHAAATLRAASLARLAERLGVPVAAGAAATDAVVDAAAAASGRPVREVADLYRSPAPRDDEALVALAAALDALEKEVRRS